MSDIRVGIVGTGFIGPAHLEALRRIGGVTVVALASREVGSARQLASRFGIPRVYDRWEHLIEDEGVEVVHTCTPNDLHFPINRAALAKGKHVLSEKPLTIASRESGALLQIARRTGRVTAVNFNYRFYPLVQHARAMAGEGRLGAIRLVHGHYLQDWLFHPTDYNWRLEQAVSGPSRAVADIGSHWCDLAQFITADRIARVCADLVTVYPQRVKPAVHQDTFKGKASRPRGGRTIRIATEDAGNILLEFASGARGVLTVSQVSAGRKNREWLEIDGSMASIAWDQEEPNRLWIGYRDRPNEMLIKDPALLAPAARRYSHYPGGHPEGYPDGPKNLFMNFYRFIRSGAQPGRGKEDFPTFADGHWENCVVEAILKSNRLKRWVTVSSKERLP